MQLRFNNELTLAERLKAPTPKFFQKLSKIGLTLAAVGAAILASPVAIPAIVVQIAGYLTLAGAVATAVSQTAVEETAMQTVPVES